MISHLNALSTGIGGFSLGLGCTWLQLRRAQAQLVITRWSADHDPLTGLPNRRALHRRFEQEQASGNAVALMLFDLDGFKAVNDTWGHHVGDALLMGVAEYLAGASIGRAVAGRLAGDEFLVLVPSDIPTSTMAHVDAILTGLGPTMTVRGDAVSGPIDVTASVGIAAPEPGASWSDHLERADIALYQAKQWDEGPVVFRPGMRHPGPCRNGRPRLPRPIRI